MVTGAPHIGYEGRVQALVTRIRAEYSEVPGLCLTQGQAERHWAVDQLTCDSVLWGLTDAGYLRVTPRGFVRA